MPKKQVTKAAKASSKSWARAHKLCELAGVCDVANARSFIAADKEEFVPLLEGKADRRNKKVRTMINSFEKWLSRSRKDKR
tara:strand:+ start:417 stop:659 length:243 start_codon:yes stop_codon:yes gene_type:complete